MITEISLSLSNLVPFTLFKLLFSLLENTKYSYILVMLNHFMKGRKCVIFLLVYLTLDFAHENIRSHCAF